MLDTEVEGSPAAVSAAATWLRDTLSKKIADAGDQQQDARNDARGSWEGETASSYQNVAGDVLRANDKHEERVKRAATALDDYAYQLGDLEADMRLIRSRASEGGLTVSGTVISMPPDVPSTEFEPGSAEETAHHTAMAKVELWNALVEDAAKDYETFVQWVDSHLPGDVTDAQEKDGSDTLFGTMQDLFPNFAAGAGAGVTGVGLLNMSEGYKAQAREFRRRSRVSGNPRVRGGADTPGGRAMLDDLLRNAEWLKKGGRFFSGPAGILIDIGFGINEGMETGDWERAGLTTGASIAVGIGAAVLLGTVGAPVLLTVVAAGALAAGASYVAGQIYDNWDDITDTVSDTWDDATDAVGDAWDSVTPW